jgi:mttA/Hcf106 family protein
MRGTIPASDHPDSAACLVEPPRPNARREYHPFMGTDLAVVLIIVLAVVLIWRGPKTLPKIGQALGRGVREARSEAAKLTDRKDDDPPA